MEKSPSPNGYKNVSMAIETFENSLFRQQVPTAKQSTGNNRNFAKTIKLVWVKLLCKMFNIKY